MNIGPLIERVESPQLSGEGVNVKISRVYNVDNNAEWQSHIPARMSQSPDGDGYFIEYSSRRGPGYTIVTLTYAARPDSPGSAGKARVDGTVRYALTINRMESMLEASAGYFVNWNYDLWAYVLEGAAVPSLPSWSLNSKDMSNADGVTWYWSKDRPPPDEKGKWYRVQTRLFPGTDNFYTITPVVSETKYCKQEQAAIAFQRTSVARVVPANTCGWGGAATNWLAIPVGYTNDGEFWVSTNEYLYSPLDNDGVGWSPLLYA